MNPSFDLRRANPPTAVTSTSHFPQVLETKMDRIMFERMDKDGSGDLTKFEYLKEMLVRRRATKPDLAPRSGLLRMPPARSVRPTHYASFSFHQVNLRLVEQPIIESLLVEFERLDADGSGTRGRVVDKLDAVKLSGLPGSGCGVKTVTRQGAGRNWRGRFTFRGAPRRNPHHPAHPRRDHERGPLVRPA